MSRALVCTCDPFYVCPLCSDIFYWSSATWWGIRIAGGRLVGRARVMDETFKLSDLKAIPEVKRLLPLITTWENYEMHHNGKTVFTLEPLPHGGRYQPNQCKYCGSDGVWMRGALVCPDHRECLGGIK